MPFWVCRVQRAPTEYSPKSTVVEPVPASTPDLPGDFSFTVAHRCGRADRDRVAYREITRDRQVHRPHFTIGRALENRALRVVIRLTIEDRRFRRPITPAIAKIGLEEVELAFGQSDGTRCFEIIIAC